MNSEVDLKVSNKRLILIQCISKIGQKKAQMGSYRQSQRIKDYFSLNMQLIIGLSAKTANKVPTVCLDIPDVSPKVHRQNVLDIDCNNQRATSPIDAACFVLLPWCKAAINLIKQTHKPNRNKPPNFPLADKILSSLHCSAFTLESCWSHNFTSPPDYIIPVLLMEKREKKKIWGRDRNILTSLY